MTYNNPNYVSEEQAALNCAAGKHDWSLFGEGPAAYCLHCAATRRNATAPIIPAPKEPPVPPQPGDKPIADDIELERIRTRFGYRWEGSDMVRIEARDVQYLLDRITSLERQVTQLIAENVALKATNADLHVELGLPPEVDLSDEALSKLPIFDPDEFEKSLKVDWLKLGRNAAYSDLSFDDAWLKSYHTSAPGNWPLVPIKDDNRIIEAKAAFLRGWDTVHPPEPSASLVTAKGKVVTPGPTVRLVGPDTNITMEVQPSAPAKLTKRQREVLDHICLSNPTFWQLREKDHRIARTLKRMRLVTQENINNQVCLVPTDLGRAALSATERKP